MTQGEGCNRPQARRRWGPERRMVSHRIGLRWLPDIALDAVHAGRISLDVAVAVDRPNSSTNSSPNAACQCGTWSQSVAAVAGRSCRRRSHRSRRNVSAVSRPARTRGERTRRARRRSTTFASKVRCPVRPGVHRRVSSAQPPPVRGSTLEQTRQHEDASRSSRHRRQGEYGRWNVASDAEEPVVGRVIIGRA